ncbi:MAG: V4R domain-containing protein [Nitrososphaerota archaeon]
MGKSLDLPLLVFRRGRRVTTLNLILKDVPGTLAKVFNAIHTRNINVVGCITSATSEESKGIFNAIYLDVTDVPVSDFRSLIKELESMDEVCYVDYNEFSINSVGSAAFSQYYEELSIFNERATIFTYAHLKGLFNGLYEKFGEGAAIFLYHLGLTVGEFMANTYKPLLEAGAAPKTLLELALQTGRIFGWFSKYELDTISKDEFRIKIWEHVECTFLSGVVNGPAGNLRRGILVGYLSKLFGGDWTVTELECINTGHEKCLFHVKKEIKPVLL